MNSEFPCNPEGLTAYLDGELSAAEAVRVEAWLAESDEARALEARQRSVRDDLRRFAATVRGPHGPKLPGEWTDRLLARLAAPAIDESSRPAVAPFSLDDLPLSNAPAPVSYWRTLAFRQTLCVGAAAAAVLLLLAAPALRIGAPNDVALAPASAEPDTLKAVEESLPMVDSEGASATFGAAGAPTIPPPVGVAADEAGAMDEEAASFYSVHNRLPGRRSVDAPKGGVGTGPGFGAAGAGGEPVPPESEAVRPNWAAADAQEAAESPKARRAADKPLAGQFKRLANGAEADASDEASSSMNRGNAGEKGKAETQQQGDARAKGEGKAGGRPQVESKGESRFDGRGQGGGGGAVPAGPGAAREDLRKSIGEPASRPTPRAEAHPGEPGVGGNAASDKPSNFREAELVRRGTDGDKSAGDRNIEKMPAERRQGFDRSPAIPAAKAAEEVEASAAAPKPAVPGTQAPPAPPKPTATNPSRPVPTPRPGAAARPGTAPPPAMPFEGGFAAPPAAAPPDAPRDARAEGNGTARRALQEQAPVGGKPQAAEAPADGGAPKEAAKQSPQGAAFAAGAPAAATPRMAVRKDAGPTAEGVLRQRALDGLALHDFAAEPSSLLILSVEMSQPAVQAAALDQVLARNRVTWRTADPTTVGGELAVALGSEGEPRPAAEPASKATAGVEAIWLEAPREVVDLILEEMAGRPEAFPQVELRSRREAAPAATAVAANAPRGKTGDRLKHFADQVRGLGANSAKGAEAARPTGEPVETSATAASAPAAPAADAVPQFAQRVRLPEAVEARLLAGADRLQHGPADRASLAGTVDKKNDRGVKGEPAPGTVRLLLLVRAAKAPTLLR